MKNKKGFTLLELLVVVLIIGILAAVALPQYQKAVIKSRITQVLPLIRAVVDAQDIYYIVNNKYAESFEDLAVDFDCPSDWTCVMGINVWGGNKANKVEAYYKTGTLGINYYYDYSGSQIYFRKLYCWAKIEDKKAVDICKTFGPRLEESGGFDRYLIQ